MPTMNLSTAAIDVLLAAERELVALAHEATASRDYDSATALLEAARRVKIMGNGDSPASGTAQSAISIVPAAVDKVSAPGTKTASVGRPATRAGRKGDYPQFLKDGDSLVKVGWSKAEKSEYEHKSPKKVLLAVAQALAAAGAKGRRFTMDKVLPLQDASDGSTLPDYQCYLCLAWIRQSGLVIQHGRQGYTLPKTGDLLSAIERCWETLPVRN